MSKAPKKIVAALISAAFVSLSLGSTAPQRS
jgi:hypothetical protein